MFRLLHLPYHTPKEFVNPLQFPIICARLAKIANGENYMLFLKKLLIYINTCFIIIKIEFKGPTPELVEKYHNKIKEKKELINFYESDKYLNSTIINALLDNKSSTLINKQYCNNQAFKKVSSKYRSIGWEIKSHNYSENYNEIILTKAKLFKGSVEFDIA